MRFAAKGQLISKGLFGVDQKTNENLLRISALASKKSSNQKNNHVLHLCCLINEILHTYFENRGLSTLLIYSF